MTKKIEFFPAPAVQVKGPMTGRADAGYRTPARPAELFTKTAITFLVPMADNDGMPFTFEDWAWLEDRVFDIAGGLSLDGTTKGKWRDDATGIVYEDESRRYKTAIDAGQVAEFTRFLAEVKVRFRQEAIFAERAVQAVAFI